jgi:hypothetical protein
MLLGSPLTLPPPAPSAVAFSAEPVVDAAAPDPALADLEALDELGSDIAIDSVSEASGEGASFQFQGFASTEVRNYLRERRAGIANVQWLMESQLELSWSSGSGVNGFIKPWLLIDWADTELHRYEPLEAYLEFVSSEWDMRVGQFTENWGIVDTFNPINVLNRRDLATDFLDPEPRGELGIKARVAFEGGELIDQPTLAAYVVPLWRETEFPTPKSRFALRVGDAVLGDVPAVTPDGAQRVWAGARLEHTLNTAAFNADCQYVVSAGPEDFPVLDELPDADVVPTYYGAWSVGGGFRAVPNAEGWSKVTFKAEVVYKRPYRLGGLERNPDDYVQFATGLDRSFNGLLASQDDLLVILEYLGDVGANDAPSLLRPFDSDVVLALLWARNDLARWSAELRAIVDVTSAETIASLELRRQLHPISDDLRVSLFGQLVRPAASEVTLLSSLPNATEVRAQLRYTF